MPVLYRLISVDDRYVPYDEGLTWQSSLLRDRLNGSIVDTLLVLEHNPVITLGRGAIPSRDLLSSRQALTDKGIGLYEADRGGEMTYHAPGQIVCYPILELREQDGERDLHLYLRKLEQVIIDSLAAFGLKAGRKQGLTGVWVDDRKIAAIGIKVSRWVTMHGFALNVDLDLTPMRLDFVPCGISTLGVTSLRELGLDLRRSEIQPVLVTKFEETFCRVPNF